MVIDYFDRLSEIVDDAWAEMRQAAYNELALEAWDDLMVEEIIEDAIAQADRYEARCVQIMMEAIQKIVVASLPQTNIMSWDSPWAGGANDGDL